MLPTTNYRYVRRPGTPPPGLGPLIKEIHRSPTRQYLRSGTNHAQVNKYPRASTSIPDRTRSNVGRKGNADKTSLPSEDPLQTPHGIRKPFYRYQPNQEAKRPTGARHNYSKPGAKHVERQPKPTTRKQSLPQPKSHLAYPPPHKKPTRERSTQSGRRKTQLQWLHAPPPDTGSNQSHRTAAHHTKITPEAKVEGVKFGVPGMPRGGQRKSRTRHEARRAWKETRKQVA